MLMLADLMLHPGMLFEGELTGFSVEMHRWTGQGPELADFPHDRPGPMSLPIPSGSVVTSHSCCVSLSERVRDSCRNQNKCTQQLTQKVIDAYCGSKINKYIIYDLGRLRNIARPKCFNTIAM